MSKVFSFRLNDDNPREAQARAVIDAWVEEGYTLRYVIVEALLSHNKANMERGDLSSAIEQLQDLILSLDKQHIPQTSETTLPNTFLDAVKSSVKLGLTSG
jgi:hypothetical protein